jgi:hypothetical protein
MKQMTPAAVERAMKLQEVMLRAMAKRITWYQAAEILGISGRQIMAAPTFECRVSRPGPSESIPSFKRRILFLIKNFELEGKE